MTEPGRPASSSRCRGSGSIRELPLAERPRERLALRGVGGLTSAELIGLVWGSGTRGRSAVDLAGDALARHDGLASGWPVRRRARDRPASGSPGRPNSLPRSSLGDAPVRLPSGRWTILGPATLPIDPHPPDGPARSNEEPRRGSLCSIPRTSSLRVATGLPGQCRPFVVRVGGALPRRRSTQCGGAILVY